MNILARLVRRIIGRARQGSAASHPAEGITVFTHADRGTIPHGRGGQDGASFRHGQPHEKARRGIVSPPAPTAADRANAQAGRLSGQPEPVALIREPGGATARLPGTGF